MRYTVTIERDEDGVFIIECPSIPGCVSQGEIEDEVKMQLKCVLKFVLKKDFL